MWIVDQAGRREFASGKDDWAAAAREAGCCQGFTPDVEEEWVADEPRSCYNCRYRRWTAAAFLCLQS